MMWPVLDTVRRGCRQREPTHSYVGPTAGSKQWGSRFPLPGRRGGIQTQDRLLKPRTTSTGDETPGISPPPG